MPVTILAPFCHPQACRCPAPATCLRSTSRVSPVVAVVIVSRAYPTRLRWLVQAVHSTLAGLPPVNYRSLRNGLYAARVRCAMRRSMRYSRQQRRVRASGEGGWDVPERVFSTLADQARHSRHTSNTATRFHRAPADRPPTSAPPAPLAPAGSTNCRNLPPKPAAAPLVIASSLTRTDSHALRLRQAKTDIPDPARAQGIRRHARYLDILRPPRIKGGMQRTGCLRLDRHDPAPTTQPRPSPRRSIRRPRRQSAACPPPTPDLPIRPCRSPAPPPSPERIIGMDLHRAGWRLRPLTRQGQRVRIFAGHHGQFRAHYVRSVRNLGRAGHFRHEDPRRCGPSFCAA